MRVYLGNIEQLPLRIRDVLRPQRVVIRVPAVHRCWVSGASGL